MQIRKIFNTNVYLDGTNSLLGRSKEVTLPEIVAKTIEHMGLGMFASVKLVSGLESLGMKLKWDGFYADRVLAGSNPFAAHKLQFRGDCEVHDANGIVAHEPVIALATVKWAKSPMGVFSPQTSPEFEDELNCHYFKLTHAGRELVEIDVFNQIWRSDGKDIIGEYRKNLGL